MPTTRKYHWLPLLACAAALWLGSFASVAQACPNCRETLPNGKQADGTAGPRVAQGYAWSIYLMIGVPFAMVATLGGTAFVLIRRSEMRANTIR